MAEELAPKAKREVEEPEQTRPGRTYVPDVDIYEDEHGLWFWADMPGVSQDQVDIELRNNLLTIRGQVLLEDYKGLSPVFTEYNIGNYECRFRLRDTFVFDHDKIKARMVNGVLELEVPKAEQAKPRRIAVTSS